LAIRRSAPRSQSAPPDRATNACNVSKGFEIGAGVAACGRRKVAHLKSPVPSLRQLILGGTPARGKCEVSSEFVISQNPTSWARRLAHDRGSGVYRQLGQSLSPVSRCGLVQQQPPVREKYLPYTENWHQIFFESTRARSRRSVELPAAIQPLDTALEGLCTPKGCRLRVSPNATERDLGGTNAEIEPAVPVETVSEYLTRVLPIPCRIKR
jgi:hypothetical protein